MNFTKIITGIGAVILVIGAAIGGWYFYESSKRLEVGAIGNQLIEQYDSYVRYNGGLKTNLPVSINADLTGAAITTTGDVTVGGGTLNVTTSNTATSTVIGGCFQFYATSTATAQKFQASTTPGVMYSSWGACPNL